METTMPVSDTETAALTLGEKKMENELFNLASDTNILFSRI
jgi:hypothetical protein